LEGVRMARALAGHDIAVEVIVDAAAAVFIHGFYTLLIGADAISAEGVVNKVGTLGLALAARAQGIPVYCLAGSEKFLTSGAPFALVERAGDELLPPAPNLRGFNLYFDQTPLELITRYFTEDGVLTASELRDRLHQSTFHAAFQFSVT
jgi:translation initiation factor 2B subunit (eIF-2B alpha/beta/delta family)